MKKPKEKEVKQTEVGRCPNCNSALGHYRIKTGQWVCRKCGTISKLRKGE